MPGRKPQRRANNKAQGGHHGTTLLLTSAHDTPGTGGGVGGTRSSLKSRRSRRLVTNPNQEEGVLYTVKVTARPPKTPSRYKRLKNKLFGRGGNSSNNKRKSGNNEGTPPPQSDDKNEEVANNDQDCDDDEENGPSMSMVQPQQYTISKLSRPAGANFIFNLLHSFGIDIRGHMEDVDSHLYRPSKPLLEYINWTFYASFGAVFLSFLGIFIVLCLLFAGLFAAAGHMHPECIVVSGNPYGDNPDSKFGDAFAMSWTTFTTVGYGNVYTATGNDLVTVESQHCSGVVFLGTLESFMGLIYAGMCAAIMFGKVNRVQSHAHLTFANAVCLQYEDVDLDTFVDDDSSDSDCDSPFEIETRNSTTLTSVEEDKKDDEQIPPKITFKSLSQKFVEEAKTRRSQFRDSYRGCPILKFQVVNDLCNKGGGEIIDGIMKVVGIKVKRWGGKITHSQYVRVNLVDCEHPFFSRVWHGVHILDASSPLLCDAAKQKIQENGGRWPDSWLEKPDRIRRKLDFQSLVMTVAGLSNVSACTVHGYKRYKFEDVIVGFDFAPLVYENEKTGRLGVDMRVANDVREQHKGSGENLHEGSCAPPSSESNHSLFDSRTMNSTNFSRGTSSIFKPSDFISSVEPENLKRNTMDDAMGRKADKDLSDGDADKGLSLSTSSTNW